MKYEDFPLSLGNFKTKDKITIPWQVCSSSKVANAIPKILKEQKVIKRIVNKLCLCSVLEYMNR